MVELIALFSLIVLSLLVVRVGTIALLKTGLPREVAAFQAQSAFMGVGFTTAESESVVGHGVRRRIVRVLMLLGFGAGTSTLGTLVITFASGGAGSGPGVGTKILILVLFVLGLALLVHIPVFDRLLDRAITKALERTTHLDTVDLHELMNLDKGYSVATLPVNSDSWLADRTLRQLALANEGTLVLNVQRETGVVIATPAARTRLHVGDQILAYGVEDELAVLHHRPAGPAGDEAHDQAVARERLRMVGERTEDEAAEVREDPPAD